MSEPKALADLIVGDRFWLGYAQELVRAAVSAPERRAEQLAAAAAWLWTIYSSAVLVALGLGGARPPMPAAFALALPSVRKVELRAAIAGLQDRIKAESKKLSAAKEQQAVATARRIGQDSAARGEMVIVTTIDAGGDRAALQSAVNALVQACPRSAVMLMDVQEGEGKVAVIAAVPKAMIDHGLKAGDWVRVASEVLGGKGGGKPDMAQGGGTHVGKVKEAIALARQHALKAAGL